MPRQGHTYNIQNVNAQGGNIIIGDATNTNQTIDHSIKNIIEEINKRGEDREALKTILAEVEQIAKEMKKSGNIPEKDRIKSFFEKASNHLSKHGWFYGAILQVLGQAALSQ
jgi:DNA-binding ferritin-like protein